jgi:hypothetical protein
MSAGRRIRGEGSVPRDYHAARRFIPRFLVPAALAVGLAGCAAITVPLTAAEVGVGGFEAFKLVETSTGGSAAVAFAEKDGKVIAPQPLPLVRRVAVWPDNENGVFFTEKLAATKRLEVVTPNRVRAILADAQITTDLNGLTDHERLAAFRLICRHSRAQLVLAARDAGSVTRTNGLSFSRPEKISKSDLLGYSCAQRRLVWRDEMTVIVRIGDKTPSTAVIMRMAGDAWAKRVLEAEASTAREIGSLNN